MDRSATKRILLISYNFSPEFTGIGKYNGEMIDWLAKSGYDCTVLTAYPYYPFWRVQAPYRRKRFWYHYEEQAAASDKKVKIYRCPMYVPSKPTGIKRILLDLSFFLAALIRLLTLVPQRKFDFVVAVAPSFQVGLLGVLYKRLRGAKLIYHVQDLQIEVARDLKMIQSEAVVNTLLKAERHILHHADTVSSISEEMARRIEAKTGKGILLFPNWTNVDEFFPLTTRRSIKQQYGFAPDDTIVLYSGAMGEKQGLEAILMAARSYRHNRNLKFILCGNGPYKDKLVRMAEELKLHNIAFLPLQPPDRFNEFLNMADIHLVLQKAGANDWVMPSKLGAILAVRGVALVTANPGTSLYQLIESHNMGYLVASEDQRALEDGLQCLLSNDYAHLGINGRKYAVETLSIDRIMRRFESSINGLWRDELLNRRPTVYGNLPL